jgi:UDP-N-acetylglucosamine diphosphorylase/glucosamine-1-phosphate N-acetyltransferase
MNIILFDSAVRHHLLPFTHTRPVADIRCGIFTMRERWEHFFQTKTSTLTVDYLQPAFKQAASDDNLYVNAAVFATSTLTSAITMLQQGECLYQDETLLALRSHHTYSDWQQLEAARCEFTSVSLGQPIIQLAGVCDIFSKNGEAIKADFQTLTAGKQSQPIPEYVTAINATQIFIAPGAKLLPCILNAGGGPIYIGEDAEIMEGSMVRGPFALGKHATIKMGAKIYGDTTIGDGCKVGGEVSNVVFFANSNKGHDGFLGNAVIGEWCNLGADTNCSNLKNNYDEVKIWSEHENRSIKTGLQFCGLLMGDHSKSGINTMFNTGTVVGVSANIYGAEFPEKFVPSFSWGNGSNMTTYRIDKAIDTANRMMGRRGKQLSEAEIAIMQHIYDETQKQRELIHSNSK